MAWPRIVRVDDLRSNILIIHMLPLRYLALCPLEPNENHSDAIPLIFNRQSIPCRCQSGLSRVALL
jgi:hypothetical protein